MDLTGPLGEDGADNLGGVQAGLAGRLIDHLHVRPVEGEVFRHGKARLPDKDVDAVSSQAEHIGQGQKPIGEADVLGGGEGVSGIQPRDPERWLLQALPRGFRAGRRRGEAGGRHGVW